MLLALADRGLGWQGYFQDLSEAPIERNGLIGGDFLG